MSNDRCACPDWKPGTDFIDGCIVELAMRYGRRVGNVYHFGPKDLKPWCHCPWCGSKLAPAPPSARVLDAEAGGALVWD